MSEGRNQTEEDDHYASLLRKIDEGKLKLSSDQLKTADDAKKYVKELHDTCYSLQVFIDRQKGILLNEEKITRVSNDRIGDLTATIEDELQEMSFPTANDFTQDASKFIEVCDKVVGELQRIREKTR